MGMTLDRINEYFAFATSATVTGVGVMTVSEKLALAGLLLGIVSAVRLAIHRRRIEQASQRRNDLIEADSPRAKPATFRTASGSCWSNCTGITRHEEHRQKCSIAVIVAPGISLAPGSVRTSKEGQQKIAGWEDCRSTPYYCTVGC